MCVVERTRVNLILFIFDIKYISTEYLNSFHLLFSCSESRCLLAACYASSFSHNSLFVTTLIDEPFSSFVKVGDESYY